METDSHHLTPPSPASAVAVAVAGDVAKRARKRSRYLSPPYTDADEGGKQKQQQHDDHEEDEEEQPPPSVTAADVLSALHGAALLDLDSQNQTAAEALRFLALFRRRMRKTSTTATTLFAHLQHLDSPSSPAPAAGAGQRPLGHALSTGPAMPLAHGSSSPANNKKKNPQHPPPAADASVNNAACGVANCAPPKKRRKKKANQAGQEQQHFGHPVALVLDFAEGSTPLPSKEHLLSAFRSFGSVTILSEAAEAGRSARVVFATRAQAEAARSCAGALGGGTFGPLATPPRLQDLPPITLNAPPPSVPKLPLTDIRKNLESMIMDLTCRSSSPFLAAAKSPQQAKPAVRDLVGEMQGLLAKVDKRLQGASSTAHRH